MSSRIICQTQFDISVTDVRGNFNQGRLPFSDSIGTLIDNKLQWQKARNQQRNWETMLQIISLRALPTIIVNSFLVDSEKKIWQFEFEVDNLSMLGSGPESLDALLHDAEQVPMIVNLNEAPGLDPWISIRGNAPNTWFWINHK